MNVERAEELEIALDVALEALEGLMGESEYEQNETIKYLLRVLNDDGDHSVED